MARQNRVVLNRAAFDNIELGFADGLFELAKAAVAAARPPDAPPIGEGLVQAGGAIAYIRGKKVADTTILGEAIKPPRAAKVSKQGILAIGGFGFPARFNELGTVHQRARPFLTPALMGEQPKAGGFVKLALAKRHAIGHR